MMNQQFLSARLPQMVLCLFLAFMLSACGGSGAYDPDEDLGPQVNYRIQGLDPGAGVMRLTREAIAAYGLDADGWTLAEASEAAMLAELDAAYNKQAPIVFTNLSPHWTFQVYDLKYLEDPLGIFAQEDAATTLVRLGLEQDDPVLYSFLDRFHWSGEDMESVMLGALDSNYEEAARRWLAEHPEKVHDWVQGLEPQEGRVFHLAYAAWGSAESSAHVVKEVLEQELGYRVQLVLTDPGPMYASLASGDSDAILDAWLPTTHESYDESFRDQYVNLGPNMEDTDLGLLVPTYMENINSIEDLRKPVS